MNIILNPKTDFLMNVDPQRDFCPGGNLAVPGGDEIMPLLNELNAAFANKGACRDMHPENHQSFASFHGVGAFSMVKLPYGDQVAWPDHCVQNTPGADFHPDLITSDFQVIIGKGYRPEVDSYSAFYENDQVTPTGFGGYLRTRGLRRIFFVGLAYDFCVGFSALDAVKDGYEAIVIEDACRAIDMDGSVAAMNEKFAAAGVIRVQSTDIL